MPVKLDVELDALEKDPPVPDKILQTPVPLVGALPERKALVAPHSV